MADIFNACIYQTYVPTYVTQKKKLPKSNIHNLFDIRKYRLFFDNFFDYLHQLATSQSPISQTSTERTLIFSI